MNSLNQIICRNDFQDRLPEKIKFNIEKNEYVLHDLSFQKELTNTNQKYNIFFRPKSSKYIIDLGKKHHMLAPIETKEVECNLNQNKLSILPLNTFSQRDKYKNKSNVFQFIEKENNNLKESGSCPSIPILINIR